MVEMPQLRNLDDLPCFPKDRRLAAAYLRGGAATEREERDVIRREAAAERERHRKAFSDMVATARRDVAANPLPPPDPMRFRAVPPGAWRHPWAPQDCVSVGSVSTSEELPTKTLL